MGIQRNTLTSLVSKAVKEGVLVFDSAAERLEYELVPQIVDNIKEFLGPTTDDRHRVKMTIEAAKGTGLFKSHQSVKVDGPIGGTILALNIQFEAPEDGAERLAGNVVGAPKTIDATIIQTD